MRHNTNDVNDLFKLLANQTRRSILLNLSTGDQSLSFLAGLYDMSLPGMAKHLKLLESAKLVRSYRVDNSAMYYLRTKSVIKLIEDVTIWYTIGKSA